jgi:hypothetical protein
MLHNPPFRCSFLLLFVAKCDLLLLFKIQNALASLTARVKLNEKGLVEGEDVESCTSRTQFYLEKGDLAKAVAEVERLSPRIKESAAKEWLIVAKDRLAVEQAAREIKAHVTASAKELAQAHV